MQKVHWRNLNNKRSKVRACGQWRLRSDYVCITKTSLFKYTENFTTKKWKFSDKNSDIFHISAKKIDCGYSLNRLGEAVLTSTTIYVFEQK